MKITPAVRRAINDVQKGDAASIEARRRWGLAVLHDPHLVTASGKSLRHGALAVLIEREGRTLSAREAQRRLQCARAYPYDSQIRHAVSDFGTWHDLVAAGFPTYDPEPGERPTDHRTPAEIKQAREREYGIRFGDEPLFPIEDFLPETTPLGVLLDYVIDQEELNAAHTARVAKKRAHINELIEAACGDLGMTWADAERNLAALVSPCGEVPDRLATPEAAR